MKRIAVVFTLFIAWLVILADLGQLPFFINFIIDEVPYGDKVGHFALFGLLNFFITRAALSTFPKRNPVRVVFFVGLTLALFVAAEEYSQNYFAKRTADWVDLFSGYAGMLLGTLAAFNARR